MNRRSFVLGIVLWVFPLVLAGCPCPCDELCQCMNDFFDKYPDADEGLTVCKPQCDVHARDHDSCVDFVAGRASPEYSEQLQMECASKFCDKIEAEPEEE